MAITTPKIVDGQDLKFYNSGNTSTGSIAMVGNVLTLAGSGTGDVTIRSGSNLRFAGSMATIGGTNGILSLGNAGDTIALNIPGVTYSYSDITASGTIVAIGNISTSGTLSSASITTTGALSAASISTTGQILSNKTNGTGAIYISGHSAAAQIALNWASSGYWGIGPLSDSNTTIRIGNLGDTSGTWSGTQNLSLSIGGQFISTIATGTAPFSVSSTTKVANLNVDRLDDMHADSSNTASTIVARDGSGNFSAGTITASLTGHASLDLQLTGGTITGDIILNDSTAVSPEIRLYSTTLNGGIDNNAGHIRIIDRTNSISRIDFDLANGNMTAGAYNGVTINTTSISGVTTFAGNASTASKWATVRTLTLGGDLTGNVTIDGSSDIILTAAIAANSVALGTDTTGNYVASVSAGTSITIGGTAGEGWTATINHADTSTLSGVYGSAGVSSITVDDLGHVTAVSTATYLTSHPTITLITDTTSTASPGYGGTFTAIDSVTKDSNGHVTKVNTKTVTMPSAQTINDAALTVTVDESGTTGNSVYITTGTGFTANDATATTYDIHVGPALKNLADYMTGTAGIGFITKTAADTYTVDSNSYALSSHIQTVDKGGTNLTSYAVGDLIYASAATTLAKLADVATGNVLISGGVGAAPSYGKVGLTTHITGTLAVGNGGTGATTLTSGYLLKGNGTSAVSASVIYDNGTNVGIGTTTPGEKVDTTGTVKADTGFKTGNFHITYDATAKCLNFNLIA